MTDSMPPFHPEINPALIGNRFAHGQHTSLAGLRTVCDIHLP
jgi:hypothetical protein